MSDTTPFLKLLTGSFSTPAGGNPTGVMVEAAYAHHDIPARFVNCDVVPAHLADVVRRAVAMGWIRFNCSLPHKQTVIEHLDELGKSASLIGAVNCVVRRGDRLIGDSKNLAGREIVHHLIQGRNFASKIHDCNPAHLRASICEARVWSRVCIFPLTQSQYSIVTITRHIW